MGIKLSVFNIILTDLRDWLSGFKIVLEGLKSFGVGFVGLEIHIFGKYNIFSDFSSHFVEISIIEEPMLGKEHFIRQMYWFDIGVLFIEGGRDVGIDGSKRGKIKCIIYIFLDIDAVVFSGVLFCHLDELKDSNVGPFLNLAEQTVIEAGASVECMQFVNC
jgi:hypothetical protein